MIRTGVIPWRKLTGDQTMYETCIFDLYGTLVDIRTDEEKSGLWEKLALFYAYIYLLSNAQRIFTEYEMRALGITEYFDGIFISSDEGCKKPDLTFFKRLIDTCGIDPAKAVMVGNDGICDIEGAKNAGLSTLYVHSDISPEEDEPDADHVLDHMDMERITEILLS